ncbi:hypothetical protein FHS85_005310 [Rhodoligotrophos appendicifer]|uniref:hypothetical protein n=1 Tax=Rhodoligotrophos appendicifer TaxID=987056 RepID=UPI00147976CD|nr:hypothetical protein [Rhodoligotrophos appendicifer]
MSREVKSTVAEWLLRHSRETPEPEIRQRCRDPAGSLQQVSADPLGANSEVA